MMHKYAERATLVGLEQTHVDRSNGPPATPPQQGVCILVWRDGNDSPMPDEIVVRDGERFDFLEWTSAYLPQLLPITSVMAVQEFHEWTQLLGQAETRSPVSSISPGAIGIIYAEAAARRGGEMPSVAESTTPHMATLSWLICQQLARPRQWFPPVEVVVDLWRKMGLFTGDGVQYPAEDVLQVWAHVASTNETFSGLNLKGNSDIAAFLASPVEARSKAAATLEPEFADQFQRLQGSTQEEIVTIFSELLSRWTSNKRLGLSAVRAMLLGFTLSRLSRGSMAHSHLLGPANTRDVRPILWYGWFDAPFADQARSSRIAIPVAQRLRSFAASHRQADISIFELLTLRPLPSIDDVALDVRAPVVVEFGAGITGQYHIKPWNEIRRHTLRSNERREELLKRKALSSSGDRRETPALDRAPVSTKRAEATRRSTSGHVQGEFFPPPKGTQPITIHVHHFIGYRAEVQEHTSRGVTRYLVRVIVDGRLVPGESREKLVGTYDDLSEAIGACDRADRF